MAIPEQALDSLELLIFDLDGTLVDSELDLALSVNAVLQQMGRKQLPTETIASYIGNGVAALVGRSLGSQVTGEEVERATALFLEYYRDHMLDHTVPYPGVSEALDDLRDWKKAVLTNKPVRFSRDLLSGLGLATHFFEIYGGNSFERKKPDPVGVLQLMSEAETPASKTLMIGDSVSDVLAGRSARVWTCGVTYGLGARTMQQAVPDLMIDDLRELARLLDGKRA